MVRTMGMSWPWRTSIAKSKFPPEGTRRGCQARRKRDRTVPKVETRTPSPAMQKSSTLAGGPRKYCSKAAWTAWEQSLRILRYISALDCCVHHLKHRDPALNQPVLGQ